MTEELIDQLANVTASYTYAAGGNIAALIGIFESGFRTFVGNAGLPVESNTPELSVKSSDLLNPARGDVVMINGDNYTVRSIRPDSEGLTLLVLSEAT
jgi:hypothetical protein